ncbi:uncharacterized protein RJT20DRAFT_133352 [Scheffersomyces xylosifermentans]|uniref:uncharacterized protein n=1 Tax=Scheffersomyces xylosifermentans TaxID=1304137 RepID=UPI00315D4C6F
MSLFRSGSYLGIPSSRLALLGPSQRMAFKDQLMKQRSASNNEETYYFKWNVWISGYQDNLGTGNKKLDIVAILVTEIDLKIFIKNELRNFLNAERSKRPAEHGRRIHIFKQGVVPIKGQLIDGYTLEIKLNHPPSVLFKQIASFIFTNRIYNDDLKSMLIFLKL